MSIFVNDTIHVEQVVSEMRETSQKDWGILTFQKELINRRGEVVQTGKTVILLARRPIKTGAILNARTGHTEQQG